MYSDAHRRLYNLSRTSDVDSRWFTLHDDYVVIAVYLIWARSREEWEPTEDEDTEKSRVWKLIPLLTDAEWKDIQDHMMHLASITPGSELTAWRIDWARTLDMVREFGR